MKEYFDKEWLKRRAEGRLSKKKLFTVEKCGDQIVFKQVKIIKRKNRKYKKKKNGRHFKRSNR